MINKADNIKYWLALKLVAGLGNMGVKNLLQSFGTAEDVFRAPLNLLETVPGIGSKTARHIKDFRRWAEVDGELEKVMGMNAAIITFQDPLFPRHLLHIYDCPFLLYVMGDLGGIDFAVALVGSRKASTYGKYTTERLSRELALKGVTVVSGMARGIDASAHRGALSVQGKTVAVLGSGLDVIYPPENEALYHEIYRSGGAVITEYSFGTRPNAPNFPSRNRIISGMSLGVVVVEATEKSGSLITARIALEQGRDVFAVPGGIDEAGARGTNRLIKEGAILVESVDDILAEIGPSTTSVASPTPGATRCAAPAAQPPADQPNHDDKNRLLHNVSGKVRDDIEQLVIDNLSSRPRPVDYLIAATGLSASEVLALLLNLELRGLIRQMPGKTYILQE